MLLKRFKSVFLFVSSNFGCLVVFLIEPVDIQLLIKGLGFQFLKCVSILLLFAICSLLYVFVESVFEALFSLFRMAEIKCVVLMK